MQTEKRFKVFALSSSLVGYSFPALFNALVFAFANSKHLGDKTIPYDLRHFSNVCTVLGGTFIIGQAALIYADISRIRLRQERLCAGIFVPIFLLINCLTSMATASAVNLEWKQSHDSVDEGVPADRISPLLAVSCALFSNLCALFLLAPLAYWAAPKPEPLLPRSSEEAFARIKPFELEDGISQGAHYATFTQ